MESIPLIAGAASIGQSLFGGKQKTQQQQQSSSGQQFAQSGPVDLTRPEFANLGMQAAGTLGGLLGGGAAGLNPYSGALTPSISPQFTQALQGSQTAALDPTRAAAIQSYASGSQVNPFVGAAIQAATQPLQLQQEAANRQLQGQFAAAGHQLGSFGSSPYVRALGNANYLNQRALSDSAASVALPAMQAAQQAQLQGIQLGQQDVQAMTQNVQNQYLPLAIQSQGIDRAIQTGQAGITNLLQSLNIAQGYPLQPIANQSTAFGTQQSQGTSNSYANPSAASLFGNSGVIPYLFGNPSAGAFSLIR